MLRGVRCQQCMAIRFCWFCVKHGPEIHLYPHHGTLSSKMWWTFPGLPWSVHPGCKPKAGEVFSWVILKLFWINDGTWWNAYGTQLENKHTGATNTSQTHHHGKLIAPARALVQDCSNVFNRRPALLGGRNCIQYVSICFHIFAISSPSSIHLPINLY